MKRAPVGGGSWGSGWYLPRAHSSQRWSQAVWPELVLLARMPPASQGIRMTRAGRWLGVAWLCFLPRELGRRPLCGIAQGKGSGSGSRVCFPYARPCSAMWLFLLSASFLSPCLCPPSSLALTFLLISLPPPPPPHFVTDIKRIGGRKRGLGVAGSDC